VTRKAPDPDRPEVVLDAHLPGGRGPDLPFGRRETIPRPRRPVLRGPILATAAVAVLAVIVAVGGGLGDPRPSSSPESDPRCAPVDPAAGVPSFRLAIAGDDTGVRGLPGAVQGPGVEASGRGWPVPGTELALDVPVSQPLHLVLATGVCLTGIHAEAWDAHLDHAPAESERQAVLETLVPLGGDIEIPGTSRGDWALRIVAEYWTGAGGPVVSTEWFFRVRVGADAEAAPTQSVRPLITPAVSCGPSVPSSAGAVVTLAAPGVAPVAGTAPDVDPPTLEVGLGEPIEIAVEGDACATSWTIDRRSDLGIDVIEGVPNIANDPGRAAQNRWTFTLPAGETVVVATFRFGPPVVVERSWRVRVPDFSIPEAFLIARDGGRVAALPGCGLSLELANGYGGADSCASIGYDGSGDRLEVSALEATTFDVPGWTIVAWSGACGRIVAMADGTTTFESDACSLGGFNLDDPSAAPDVRFVLRPGEHVVQLQVTAVRDGDRFSAPFYALVRAE
jgi:hypothetical protein